MSKRKTIESVRVQWHETPAVLNFTINGSPLKRCGRGVWEGARVWIFRVYLHRLGEV